MTWGSITGADLARYRVVYAVFGLAMLPSFTWLADYPDALYRPPPGPFRLFAGFPPAPVLSTLGLLTAVALGCLLVGAWVRPASWTASGAMLAGFGFTYSLGKIDHNFLFVVTPVVMLAAGWAPGAMIRPWILRLWAFTVGTAMLTAGLAKLFGGWLDLSTHAVRGYTFEQVYSFHLTHWLGRPMTHISSPWVWEPMDWAAVFLECSILVLAVLGLQWFRYGLALLTVFHLAVMLMLNITFAGSVVVYGGFASWSALKLPSLRCPAVVGVLAGVIAFLVRQRFGDVGSVVGPAVIIFGAVFAIWWLARSTVSFRMPASDRVNSPA